jgi:hypothetical protein
MKLTVRSLAALILGGCCLLVGMSCTQNEDVVQPQMKATITLEPEYLPQLDTLYTYELWMVKVDGEGDSYITPGAQFFSLGKFVWDEIDAEFQDVSGAVISNSFEIPEPYFNYDYIVISVENRHDLDPDAPSKTYILADKVVDPKVRPMELKFPANLFLATGFYFVSSPTDDTSYYVPRPADSVVIVARNNQKGLWLCSRFFTEQPGNVQDTLGLKAKSNGQDSVLLVTTAEKDTGDLRFIPDTVGVIHPPGDWPSVVLFDTLVLGYDSIFDHRRVDFQFRDTVDTNNDYILYVWYDTTRAKTYGYYEYAGPMENLPDIRPYGWRYNGWIFLEQPDTTVSFDNAMMDLSPMTPFGRRWQENYVGKADWGVLPLGNFYRPDSADLSNQYLDNREVPEFPGEDFVKNASPRFDHLNLLRVTDYDWGSIVVGMEPIPENLNIDQTGNFPLFILSDFLRSGDAGNALDVQVFHNWTQFLPTVPVTVTFHE